MQLLESKRFGPVVIVLGFITALAACGPNNKAPVDEPAPGGLPDLTVLSVSAQASAARGATINVVHVTKNLSNDVAQMSTSKFYLTNTPVAALVSYINQQSVPALDANSQAELTNTTFVIPTNAKLGTNYIIVVCAINIQEYNKSNNTNTTCKINITP